MGKLAKLLPQLDGEKWSEIFNGTESTVPTLSPENPSDIIPDHVQTGNEHQSERCCK
jgi:hypothetical protein